MPPLSINQLADDFLDVATRAANAHAVTLGPGADNDIRAMTLRAAERVLDKAQNTGATAEQFDELRDEGRRAFEALIDEMVAARPLVYGPAEFSIGHIGEQTLAHALSILCPLFPIC